MAVSTKPAVVQPQPDGLPADAGATPDAALSGLTSPTLESRLARAAALAALNAPAEVASASPPAVTPWGEPQPVIVDREGIYSVPVLPQVAGFTGLTLTWYPGGEPYRVRELVFPCVVAGQYQVATFGDVVILDEATAAHGLKHRSIELIPE